MAKKSSASSQPEKLRRLKNESITLDDQAKAELAALDERPINLTDPEAPEITDWSRAERGKFYRPVRQEIAVELDKDVLEWFQKQPEPTQSLINQVCRDYMQQHVNSGG